MYIFISISTQNQVFLYFHILFAIALILDVVGLAFLIKITPPKQAVIRKYLIFIQANLILQDVTFDVGLCPMFLFPAPAGYALGLLMHFGVSAHTGFSLVLLIYVWVGGAIVICIMFRHQTLLPKQSILRVDEACDQATDPHNLTWIRDRGVSYYITERTNTLRNGIVAGVSIMIGSVVLSVLTFGLMFYFLQKDMTKRSAQSLQLIRRSILNLFCQLVIPLIFFYIPAITILLGVAFENFLSFALITLDYAQKWLPSYYRESQKLYFGKAGLSWHIAHVLSNVTGRLAQHSFVHLMKGCDQNSTTVVEIIRHTLSELKKAGIEAVHLRSDNAGYYHSSASIASMPDIIAKTGVKVLSWSFSESQSGKSSSDRIAALVKRKMRDYISKRNNVDTPEEMFRAITTGKLLQGLSVHLGTIRQTMVSPTKIDKISELGHFQYAKDRMRAWRYRGIGEGREFLFKNLHHTQAQLLISMNGGKVADKSKTLEERKNITEGKETTFWYVPPLKDPHAHPHEVNDVDDDSASDEVHRNPINAHGDSVFFCPVCGASFIRHSNLVAHFDSGRHKIRPERVSLLDYSLNLFKGYLEDIKQAVAIAPLSDSLQALQTGGDEELEMGWALRTTKKGGRYPERAKTFVRECFEAAMAQGRKIRGEEVELLMKDKDEIAPEDRMTLDQIRNFIRTLAAPPKEKKTRKPKTKTRGSRNVPVYTDEDGWIEEEVDITEADHVYTDDDEYFDDVYNQEDSNGDIGHDFE